MKQMFKLSVIASAITLSACQVSVDPTNPTPDTVQTISVAQIGRFATDANKFEQSAAEIVAFDASSDRVFVVNAQAVKVDVLNLADVTNPVLIDSIDATLNWADAGGINSVNVKNGLLIVAVEHKTKQQNGRVQIYNAADLTFRSQVEVGALPDNVAFTNDGLKAVVANEGEPSADYSVDPEGSISIIDLNNVDAPTATQISFAEFNVGGARAAELPSQVRIYGNAGRTELAVTAVSGAMDIPASVTVSDATGIQTGDWLTLASTAGEPIAYRVAAVTGNVIAFEDEFNEDSAVADATAAGLTVYLHDGQSTVAQDLEPEYVAIAADNSTAYVSLQEKNAIAVVDINNKRIDRIIALALKDHSLAGNEMDASDKDNAVNIQAWPVKGMYMPDSIATFDKDGKHYIVTANEGDSRAYNGFVEEVDIKDVGIDSDSFANAAELEASAALGSLATSLVELKTGGDTDQDGKFDSLYSYGARSFTIWDDNGGVVFDSGAQFALKTAELYGIDFNNTNSKNDGDSRSDNKGAEPEALAIGTINDHMYAFIGLERTGGVMVYDITNPAQSSFVQYLNNRDFAYPIKANIVKGDQPAHVAGDLGPEGFKFVSASDSPSGQPLLIVGNEVSGTTTIYQMTVTVK